ncbi:TPA: OXA-184 family class D beta-lactamase OXA-618 [Campylobacter jejuni]|uniref:beta-lactamase n=1 Tax=Campylobacter jejuni TaxID=197 RepID=A0A2S1CWW4_CAMJU|nr:OXA-184 family class D beta-lactamase OXA-618 [Campylobacter jejuni]AWD39725.1 OXA-184 family class D beta-lactamase OXA-618 [Campylobacter jejuni]HEG2604810.1 OXA-184 family class D beta-lactamase OXA-618 [Campylobacter jejuni]HEG2605781.1 OXA-184 family class D beta-lactamase OXA-618 [Campylobacter jejuni]
MRNFIVFILFLNIAIGEDKILGNFFKDYNTSGTFMVFDGKNYASNDFKRAKKAFSPASTFKIFNALIALDNGVVRDTKEIFYHYKGEKVFLPSWKQDASLSSAIKRSQVPAFKELARKIGLKTMQESLNKLSYGNAKISKIDTFWLDNSLQISAKNQVDLLFKLSQNSLPFSKKIQEEVKEIILFKEDKIQKIYAKTGFNDNINLAWIVGFVKTENKILSFALNVDIKDIKNIKIREELLNKYLANFFNNNRIKSFY